MGGGGGGWDGGRELNGSSIGDAGRTERKGEWLSLSTCLSSSSSHQQMELKYHPATI